MSFGACAAILSLFFAAKAGAAPPEPKEIIERSIGLDRRNWERLRDYTFVQQNEQHQFDRSGQVRKTESATYDVLILDGTPYRRKIARNGQPLPEAEARKENEKFERERQKRLNETAAQRQRRLEKERKDSEETRAFLREVPEAYLFRLAGEETVEGRRVWVIDAEPRPGFRPKVSRASILSKIRGRLWIDQTEYQWVRVEAETVAPISFGLVLARLAAGTRMSFRQTRINNEVWLPTRIHTRLDARLALVKRVSVELEVTFHDYRKFSAESRLVPVQ